MSEYLILRKKCPYSELFWPIFSPNAGKCTPEYLQIRRLFTQCETLICSQVVHFYWVRELENKVIVMLQTILDDLGSFVVMSSTVIEFRKK